MIDELRARRGRRITVDPFDYPALHGKVFAIHDAKVAAGTNVVFVAVRDAGKLRWFREDETLPAPAPTQESPMSDEQKLISMAEAIAVEERIDLATATKRAGARLRCEADRWVSSIRAADGTPAAHGLSTPSEDKPGQAAVGAMVRQKVAQGMSPDEAVEATFVELTWGRAMEPFQPFALASTFDQAVARRRAEKRIGWREATLEVSRERPDLAASR